MNSIVFNFSRCITRVCSVALLAVAMPVIAAGWQETEPGAKNEIQTLAGERIECQLQGIDADGNLSGDLANALNLADVSSIRTGIETEKAPVKYVIRMAAGGQFHASQVLVEDGFVKWKSTLGEFEVGVGAVRAILFKPFKLSDLVTRTVESPSDESDQVVAEGGSGQQAVAGLVEAIKPDKVEFNFRGTSRSIPLDRVVAVVMVDLQESLSDGILASIKFRDSSAVTGTINGLNDGQLEVGLVGGASIKVPWEQVTAINVRSDRLVYLSDLTPIEYEHRPIVTRQSELGVDVSVDGNPLSLYAPATKELLKFQRGISIRSESRVAYKNDGYGKLVAKCGIDWETRGNGDCVLTVRGDGIELWQARLVGGEDPVELDLEIADYEEIVFLVDAGEHLDMADHVTIAEARFIKVD